MTQLTWKAKTKQILPNQMIKMRLHFTQTTILLTKKVYRIQIVSEFQPIGIIPIKSIHYNNL